MSNAFWLLSACGVRKFKAKARGWHYERREKKQREEKVDKVQVELYRTIRPYFCKPQTIRHYFCKPQRQAVNPEKVINCERNIHVP
jgi:hypothetical protein